MKRLPSGWRFAPLAEIADVTMGQSPPGNSYSSTGEGAPFFQGKSEFTELHPVVRKYTTAGTKFAKAGDVLLSVRAPVGPTNVAGVDCAIGRGLAAIRARPGIDQRYLLWVIRATVDDLAAQSTGSTFGAVSGRQVRSHRVPVAPVTEQRRIVEVLEDHLSRLDAASTLLSSAVARWEALWQTAAEGELTGRRVTGERNESPGLSEEGVDDGALPQLPFGWRWQRLRDVADVVGGVTKDAKRQTDPSLVEIPYLRVANVQRGFLDLANVTTIRVPRPTAEGLRLMAGDVLLNEGGDRDKLGRGWVWEGQIDGCIHQNHVFRARVRDSAIDPYLLSWAANTIGGRWCERNGRQSVNLASISLSRIRLMPVPVPPRVDQPAILGRLNALLEGGRKLRSNARAASTRAESLRRSLLYTAFSGRLTGARTDEEIMQELAGV